MKVAIPRLSKRRRDGDPSDPTRLPRAPRACVSCRSRKIKCCGEEPQCANCRNSGQACVYTQTRTDRLKESTEYNKKLVSFLISLAGRVEETDRSQIEALLAEGNTDVAGGAPVVASSSAQAELQSETELGNDTKAADPDLVADEMYQCRDFLDHLVQMPDHMAHRTLQELRMTTDRNTFIRNVSMGSVDRYLSERTATLSMMPFVHSIGELELQTRYPSVYLPLESIQLDVAAQRLWPTSEPPLDISTSRLNAGPVEDAITAGMVQSSTDSHGPSGQGDHLSLRGLNANLWTSVPVSNELVRTAVSFYLNTDHRLIGVFDAFLFVGDLVSGHIDFCSPFLVNSLLAFAFRAYATAGSDASSKSAEFEAVAETLWHSDKSHDSVLNISGLALMILSKSSRGQADDAKQYLKAMVEMASRMNLFGNRDTISILEIANLPKEIQISTACAAWGAFNLLGLKAMLFLTPAVQYPPKLPVPGISETRAERLNENLIDDLDASTSEVFAALCSLWVIITEILLLYRQPGGSQGVLLTFALSKFGQLLSLSERLSKSLSREQQASAHVLVFHIYFHVSILELFRPFLPNESQFDLNADTLPQTLPESIFASSLAQLKTITIEFRSQYSPTLLGTFWHPGLLYTANAVLKNLHDPQWRPFFEFCINTYNELSTCLQYCDATARGLLFMALSKRAISNSEVWSMLRGSEDRYTRILGPSTKIKYGFVVDLDLAMVDLEGARVDSLVEKFEQVELFGMFLNDVA